MDSHWLTPIWAPGYGFWLLADGFSLIDTYLGTWLWFLVAGRWTLIHWLTPILAPGYGFWLLADGLSLTDDTYFGTKLWLLTLVDRRHIFWHQALGVNRWTPTDWLTPILAPNCGKEKRKRRRRRRRRRSRRGRKRTAVNKSSCSWRKQNIRGKERKKERKKEGRKLTNQYCRPPLPRERSGHFSPHTNSSPHRNELPVPPFVRKRAVLSAPQSWLRPLGLEY